VNRTKAGFVHTSGIIRAPRFCRLRSPFGGLPRSNVLKKDIGIQIRGDSKEYIKKLLREYVDENKMTVEDVKFHVRKYFGYELPQTQINVFSNEFVDFCLYISAEHRLQADAATAANG
jgi:hypothetical protein